MVRAYDPNQKRAEKGSDNGGQWVADNSKGGGEKKSRVSEAESKRYSELEAKFNKGTITDEELGEAHDLVEKAAKAAGYDLSHRRESDQDPTETGNVILFADDSEANRHYGDYNYLIKSDDLLESPPEWMQDAYVEFLDAEGYLKHIDAPSEEDIVEALMPSDIIDSADAWDSPEFVSYLWNFRENEMLDLPIGLKTPDGAVVWDGEGVKGKIKSADIFTGTPLAERFNDKDDRIMFSHAVKAYDPNQKRGEKGSPDGGRWVKKDGSSSSDEASDADYLAAVEAGDTEAAQAMVDAKAKAAGYDVEAFHGTDAESFESFDRELLGQRGAEPAKIGFWFSDDEEYSKNHGERVVSVYLKTGNNYTLKNRNDLDSIEAIPSGYESLTIPSSEENLGRFTVRNASITAVRNPNQIKSADPVTYDSDGKVVPLSKRFDDKDDRITFSHAVKAAEAKKANIDQLSDNVLESLTGVTREWLSPVRPHFEKLAAMAMSKQVSDADFIEALEKSQREMPELFDKLNVEALQTSMEDAIGTAMIVGSVERYEADEVKAYDPNQKRGEKGSPDGGQWVKDDGGAGESNSGVDSIYDAGKAYDKFLKDDNNDSDGWDLDEAFKNSVKAEIEKIASPLGWEVSSDYDSQSTYFDVSPPYEAEEFAEENDVYLPESFQVRVSNHKQVHTGPIWSFEPAESKEQIQKGLDKIKESIGEWYEEDGKNFKFIKSSKLK
jgi:hypothetical protein